MALFNKPILVKHVHEVKLEGATEAIDHGLDRLSEMMKTAGKALLIGIPSVILFALTAHAISEIAIDQMTSNNQ